MTSQDDDSIDEAIRQGVLPNLPSSEEEEKLLDGNDDGNKNPRPFWEKTLEEAALSASVGTVIRKYVEQEIEKEREHMRRKLREGMLAHEKMDIPTDIPTEISTPSNGTPPLIEHTPQPLLVSTPRGIPGPNSLQQDLNELADFIIGVAADLTRAHLRLSEHIQYKETGRIPRGMQSGSTVNAFRSGDTKIAHELAELKQQYHTGIIDALIVHYTKVVSKLEEDQKRGNEREEMLRRRYPGSPLWENYEEYIKHETANKDAQPSFFSRYSRKRTNGNADTNDTAYLTTPSNSSRPKRKRPELQPELRPARKRRPRRGKKRPRRLPKQKVIRPRSRRSLLKRRQRLSALLSLLSKIKKDSKANTVINLSSRVLTTHEHSVLQKGLSFCPTPLRPNKKDLLKSITGFARKLRLQYYFTHQNPINKTHPKHPLKPKSSFTLKHVKNHQLEHFITALKSHALALKPKRPRLNTSKEERTAIKNLKSYKDIVIKRADKGSCIVIEDTTNYITEGLTHLTQPEIYKPLTEDPTPAIVNSIATAIQHFYQHGPLDYYTYKHLLPDPENTRTQILYFLKKLHKNPHGVRPICSGSSGPTELISALVDSYLQPIATQQPSYIRDSSHLIKILDNVSLPSTTILVALDVKSLYPSIPQNEAINVCGTFVQQHYNDPNITNMIKIFLYYILANNTFIFNNKPYLQLRGTAMGTKTAPSLANLFMAHLEQKFLTSQPHTPLYWLRYIDDIFLLWTTSEQNLNTFLTNLNEFHPTIKFTSEISHTNTTFLDIDIFKGNRFNQIGILDITTHIKPTNKFQYLHYTSSHPISMKRSVVTGELHRFLRSTSSLGDFLNHRENQKTRFLNRGYPRKLIKDINKQFPFTRRTQLIEKIPDPATVTTKENSKPPLTLVIPYDPWFPSLRKTLNDLWKRIETTPLLHSIFPTKPKIAFKRTQNLADTLVRAKLPTTTTTPTSNTPPTTPPTLETIYTTITPCKISNCKCCPILRRRTSFTSLVTNETYPITDTFSCSSKNLIYLLECPDCGKQYIGQTTTTLAKRMQRHRSHYHQKKDLYLYAHFHDHGWKSLDKLGVQPIDSIPDSSYDLHWLEQHWISCLETRKPKGLNAKDERLPF